MAKLAILMMLLVGCAEPDFSANVSVLPDAGVKTETGCVYNAGDCYLYSQTSPELRNWYCTMACSDHYSICQLSISGTCEVVNGRPVLTDSCHYVGRCVLSSGEK